MSTLFVILMLVSLGLLILGVINPVSLSKFSNKPLRRKDAGVGFGVLALVFMVLTGITAPEQSSQTRQGSDSQTLGLRESKATEIKVAPVLTKETVTETQEVPFTTSTVNDSNRTTGTSVITTAGVNGTKTFTYEITKSDGVQTGKRLVKEEVTKAPVTQITAIGTKVATRPKQPASSSCDPNYSGACVPIASDVDCGGGSGNGPAYVYGTVRVIGSDIYDLDRDGDGYGCE